METWTRNCCETCSHNTQHTVKYRRQKAHTSSLRCTISRSASTRRSWRFLQSTSTSEYFFSDVVSCTSPRNTATINVINNSNLNPLRNDATYEQQVRCPTDSTAMSTHASRGQQTQETLKIPVLLKLSYMPKWQYYSIYAVKCGVCQKKSSKHRWSTHPSLSQVTKPISDYIIMS